MKKTGVLLFLLVAFLQVSAQRTSPEEYIQTYKDLAISEMVRTGVPASITLAQGIHESESGNSNLVKRSNNHFGIKCKSTWTGEKVYHTDDAVGECFRKYARSEDSYRDHSDFLRNNQRYASLFQLEPTDYEGWAYGLKKAGYATNSKYAPLLVSLVEKYNLGQYDLAALNRQPKETELAVKETREPETKTPAAPVTSNAPATKNTTAYPTDKIFYINETKVVYAPEGTSLLALAMKHQVDLSKLVDFNDLDDKTDILENGQLIFLQRKRKQGALPTRIVKSGESLYDIAQTEGIRLDALLELNHLDEDALPEPGETIYLKAKAPAAPRLIRK
ncbi:MAG: glucosaminidase domain-containing protein [Dinghuibacter sp.]|nr:glucosaminidase domain-containing protein [Dinghuibacter sp.]